MSSPEPASRDRELLDLLAAAREQDAIERALEAARERLGMDAAYVTTVTGATQRIDEVAGDSSALGFTRGTELPLEDTYCVRMLRGDLPNVVPDTRAEPVIRNVGATARIRAYVGVPVVLEGGATHGSLCCASASPRPDLGADELRFMRVLAGIIATRISRARRDTGQRADPAGGSAGKDLGAAS